MLLNLHVKNLALIQEADVEFAGGLNILTGETGAGKSIIIGSVNMALGGKAPKDSIRQGSEYAYIELVFSVEEEKKREALKGLEVFPDEDNLIIISKKIMPLRSVSKINDETVTTAKLKQVTGLLIDIHGQHEHQSLLHPSKHLEILDEYAKTSISPMKQKIASLYQSYTGFKKRLEDFMMDQESRQRQVDFYRFEIDEIENAALKPGEEETLSAQYRKFVNARKITSALQEAYETVGDDRLGHALKNVGEAAQYDEELLPIKDQLFDVDAILEDIRRGISSYMEGMEFDQEEFEKTESRLDLIHNLQSKYGGTTEAVLKSLEEKRGELEELINYDALRCQTEKELSKAEEELNNLCAQLTAMRQEAAGHLSQKIREGLSDLNFLDNVFTMEFRRLSGYTAGGLDEAEFMISTNPGEPAKPLGAVASGGELSRIMLAIKAVLAETDDIPTLIFDEIDAGISGRTAQMVSEKMRVIARNHQILCITHLPQIAAMADTHFEIAKATADGKTTTEIHRLQKEESVAELARLLGGARITDTVMKTAWEMKALAEKS